MLAHGAYGASAGLDHLGLEPLLDLGLRLGEGTGALLAVPLVQAAAKVLREMATFDSAGASSVVIKGEGSDGPPADTDKFNEAATACQSEGLGGGFRVSGGSDGSSSGVGSVSAAAGQ